MDRNFIRNSFKIEDEIKQKIPERILEFVFIKKGVKRRILQPDLNGTLFCYCEYEKVQQIASLCSQ